MLQEAVRTAEEDGKATVFGYWVSDPERYGVAEFDVIKYDSFIITCLEGDCIIKIGSTGDEVVFHEGYSCLILAVISDYDYIVSAGKKCRA